MEINFATLREIVSFMADVTTIVIFVMQVSQHWA